MARYAYIDALRGYAILMVIFVHASQRIGGLQSYVYYIGDQGARGVQLFFVASAITLCMSWHRRSDGTAKFYVRRLFRIAPMFWLAIVYFVSVQGLGPRGLEPSGIGLKHIVLTALFAHGFLPSTFSSVVPGGWSIAVEMMFYAIFPFLVVRLKTWKMSALAAVVALIPAALVYASLQWASESVEPQSWNVVYKVFSTLNFVHQFPVFLIGITAYHLIREEQFEIERRPFLVAAVSLFPVIVILTAYHRSGLRYAEFGFHSAFAIAFAGFAIWLARDSAHPIVNRYIVWIGKISFSGYLWHLALISVLPANFRWLSPLLNFALFYALLTAATLALSYLTYRFIEMPMVRFGNRLLDDKKDSSDARPRSATA